MKKTQFIKGTTTVEIILPAAVPADPVVTLKTTAPLSVWKEILKDIADGPSDFDFWETLDDAIGAVEKGGGGK